MSKFSRPFLLIFAAALLISQPLDRTAAQDVAVTLEVDPARPSIVNVTGRFVPDAERPRPPSYLSFVKQYAGVFGLGSRVSKVLLKDAKGNDLPFRSFQAGEYVAEVEINEFSYSIDLTPLKDPSAAGHVSWLTAESGILFMNDLLPESQNAVVTLKGLNGLSVTRPDGSENDRFSFLSRESGVLFVGRAPIPSSSRDVAGRKIITASSDKQTLDSAAEIFSGYSELFGPWTGVTLLVGVQNYPVPVGPGNYEADTRGSTITIVSSGTTFESQSAQRLHEQLRHEMFHLWIPESVNLTGNYDWFYEGFALYQSLKLGVSVNRLRFEDYLDTLSRAYEIDRRLGGKVSLIDASRNRWAGDNNTVVYARGMLVAFLCDLALMNASKGKVSSDEIIHEVYAKHSGRAASRDGNESVIAVLKARPELSQIVDAYVSGTNAIDWAPLISAAGLQAEARSGATALTVVAKPNSKQKRLLDKLGYNNWRKLVSK